MIHSKLESLMGENYILNSSQLSHEIRQKRAIDNVYRQIPKFQIVSRVSSASKIRNFYKKMGRNVKLTASINIFHSFKSGNVWKNPK